MPATEEGAAEEQSRAKACAQQQRCTAASVRFAAVRAAASPEVQGYQRRELWDEQAWCHLAAGGHSMPATWSLQDASLSLPGPAGAAAADDGGARSSTGPEAGNGGLAHGGQQLWVHMPEGSYRWEQVAECPVYVRCAMRVTEGRLVLILLGCLPVGG